MERPGRGPHPAAVARHHLASRARGRRGAHRHRAAQRPATFDRARRRDALRARRADHAPLLDPHRYFEKLVVDFDREAFRIVNESGNFSVLHCHGHLRDILDPIAELSPSAVEPLEVLPAVTADVSMEEIKRRLGAETCLMGGIPLVIMHRFSPSQFWQTVKDKGATFFYVLGTMPFYLMKQEENPELEKKHRLRLVICSGIHPKFHATFEERWNVPWREAFGMTETGPDLLVPPEDTGCVGSGAMGSPIRTKEARVVDADDNEVPDGEIGELVLRGEPMMLGYWKKPEATAEIKRGGWLHTGDLVYKDERGYFHWVGRIKDMVRRSGENISTSEVEGVLVQHKKIKLAAVLPAPDQLRGEEVKAYIVLLEGETKETAPPE